MKKIAWALISLVLVLSMLMAIPASAAWAWNWSKTNKLAPKSEEYAFSFALVGDTQSLSMLDANTEKTNTDWGFETADRVNKGYMSTIYTWIANNVETKKIAHVFGLGDITQNRSTAEGRKEFEVASAAWSVLDGKVPYSLVRGNHDGMGLYQEFVCDEEYIAQFDGVYSSGSNVGRSTYKKLDIGEMKFLLISLDFGASDIVLSWAEKIIRQNPDRKVIISTHGYLAQTERRTSAAENDWISASDGGYNLGEAIWSKLVKKHSNVLMVLCGHMYADPIAYRTDTGIRGNTVHEIMFNPQDYDFKQAPSGMVAMMYFSNDGTKCWLEYYSTVMDFYCKLPITEIVFDTPLLAQTTAPETTAASLEATATSETTDTQASSQIETNAQTMPGSCKSIIFIPALPVSVGCAAFAVRKRKAKISK